MGLNFVCIFLFQFGWFKFYFIASVSDIVKDELAIFDGKNIGIDLENDVNFLAAFFVPVT